jgi:hypothetical protein
LTRRRGGAEKDAENPEKEIRGKESAEEAE